MRRRPIPCLPGRFALGLLASAVLAGAADGQLALDSRITHVTVYPGWARVQRTGKLQLEPGRTTVRLAGLPAWLDTQSVQTQVNGLEGAELVAARARAVTAPAHTEEALKQAEADVAGALDAVADAATEVEALKAEMDYLTKLMPWRLEKLPIESTTRPVTAAELKEVNDYLTQARLANLTKSAELNRKMRQLQDALKAKEETLAEMKQRPALESMDVLVVLQAPAAGPAELEVSYLVAGASWYPEHVLSLDNGGKDASFRTLGMVQQATGEDWAEVALVLSASHPFAAQATPVLATWHIAGALKSGAPAPEVLPFTSRVTDAYGARLLALTQTWREIGSRDEETAKAVKQVEANRALAAEALRQASARGTAVELLADGRFSAPGDGEQAVASCKSEALTLARRYRVVPAVSDTAFAIGVGRNTTSFPWLPGAVNLHQGTRIVGAHALDLVGLNETFEIELGPTSALKVERRLQKEQSRSAQVGAKTRLTLSYTIRVKNDLPTAAELEVRDQIPVGDGKTLAVELLTTSPRAEIGQDGVILWKTTLAANQTTELAFGVQLVYPKGAGGAGVRALERQVAGL